MEHNEDAFAVSTMMQEVDQILAEHMLELSPEEREQSYSDVHGISGEISETPLLIAQSLARMEAEIQQIQPKDAYNLAKAMKPDYVKNPGLWLKFLRGERFDARPAAQKLVKHFELKRDLFGVTKLVKDIEQDDMSEEDIDELYGGYVQWSPLKDSAQRTVAIMFPLLSSERDPVMSRVSCDSVMYPKIPTYLHKSMRMSSYVLRTMVTVTFS